MNKGSLSLGEVKQACWGTLLQGVRGPLRMEGRWIPRRGMEPQEPDTGSRQVKTEPLGRLSGSWGWSQLLLQIGARFAPCLACDHTVEQQ